MYKPYLIYSVSQVSGLHYQDSIPYFSILVTIFHWALNFLKWKGSLFIFHEKKNEKCMRYMRKKLWMFEKVSILFESIQDIAVVLV